MNERVVEGHVVRSYRGRGRPWVLLHGFTGAPASFDPFWSKFVGKRAAIAVALPGHASQPTPAGRFEDAVDGVARVMRAVGGERLSVLGYSLGARVAYGLASRHPTLVDRLVAIGGHPGLRDADARHARHASDTAWADRLQGEGTAAFMRAWAGQPLFMTQLALPTACLDRQRRLRRGHLSDRLAMGLLQLSLSQMPSWTEALKRFPRRIDLIAGEADPKFVGVLCTLAREVPSARMSIARNTGHNVLLENPRFVANVLRNGRP